MVDHNPVGVPVVDPSDGPNRPVIRRNVRLRAMVYAADGAERPYDVYRFSRNRKKYERPGHNPFDD